ncbi:MAG: hypothetical protein HYY06_05850 [Deltaproteobacteria bacterium]|nr:hypothetical protein [Deltaproteobacteria bacterium]
MRERNATSIEVPGVPRLGGAGLCRLSLLLGAALASSCTEPAGQEPSAARAHDASATDADEGPDAIDAPSPDSGGGETGCSRTVGPSDRFGGRTTITGEATGFFHLEEIDGASWLVTPEGNAFFAVSVEYVHPSWESMETYERLYGNDRDRWAQDTVDTLGRIGINTIGSDHFDPRYEWLTALEGAQPRMPYLLNLGNPDTAGPMPNGYAMRGARDHGRVVRWPDVFDPAEERRMAERISMIVSRTADDEYLIGYLTNTEPNQSVFGYFSDWWQDTVRQASGTPGKQAYVDHMEARYGTIEAFKAVYGGEPDGLEELLPTLTIRTDWFLPLDLSTLTPAEITGLADRIRPSMEAINALESWDDLSGYAEPDYLEFVTQARWDAYDDHGAFLATIAARYASICHDAIRASDPDHLILGPKHMAGHHAYGLPRVVAVAEAPFQDAMALNSYLEVETPSPPQIEGILEVHERTGLPIIFSEMGGFMAADHPIYGGGDDVDFYVKVANQDERGARYDNYLTMIARSLPMVFGASYYSTYDHAGANWGVLSGSDFEPYQPLACAIGDWSFRIYDR